jgi:hypothetical protein
VSKDIGQTAYEAARQVGLTPDNRDWNPGPMCRGVGPTDRRRWERIENAVLRLAADRDADLDRVLPHACLNREVG